MEQAEPQSAPEPAPPSRGRWLVALAAVVAALVLPLLLVDVPPILDYPNHLARLYVLAFGPADPALSRMYAPHWRILPNLAIDLLGPPLMHLFPVHVAGRMLLAGAMLLPLAGSMALHRALFGRRSYWPLAAGLCAVNGLFLLGFVNFLWGVGIAMLGAAAWIATRRRSFAATLAVGVGAAILAFLCHLFGAALFAILVGSQELARLWRLRREGRLDVRALLATAALLTAIALPLAVLYLASPLEHAHSAMRFSTAIRKVEQLFVPFLTYSKPLGLITGGLVAGAVILLRRRFAWDLGALIALVILLLAYLAVPFAAKSGSFIDVRLPVMMAFLLFAAGEPRLSPRTGVIVAAGVAALLLVRTGFIAQAWVDHRSDLADFRATIAAVPPGAKVMVVSADPAAYPDYARHEPRERVVPSLYRTDRHLAALLVIERRAFWPLMFADPTQQPLVVRAPYDRIAFPLGEPVDYRALLTPRPSAYALGLAPYLRDWRGDFDYVLLLDAGAIDAAKVRPDAMRLVASSDIAALYRVRRPVGMGGA